MPHPVFSPAWVGLKWEAEPGNPQWRATWAISGAERTRQRALLDALVAYVYGLDFGDLCHLLRGCDLAADVPRSEALRTLDPKGFWRVDKDKDPELRHTVLTLVAFRDLEAKVSEQGGDREKGIAAFCDLNGGEGWMLPETLRLADYGLGHDERAKHPQPVASRLGPRFYDWQLAQTPEESWRECHLHARNLLGEEGYKRLLTEIESGGQSDLAAVAEPAADYDVRKNQGQLKLL